MGTSKNTGEQGVFLDALVTRLVFRTIVVHDGSAEESYMVGDDYSQVPLIPFSSDLKEAMGLVDRMRVHGFSMSISTQRNQTSVSAYGNGITTPQWTSSEPATAICLAAVDAWHRSKKHVQNG